MSETEPTLNGAQDDDQSGAAQADEAIASAEDFTVSRDEDGHLLPVKEKVPGRDTYVRVIPIGQGKAERLLPADGNVTKLDDEAMLTVIREHYVEPDFSHVESVDEFKAFGLDPLLMAVMNASGFDMSMGMVAENQDLTNAVEGNSRTGN